MWWSLEVLGRMRSWKGGQCDLLWMWKVSVWGWEEFGMYLEKWEGTKITVDLTAFLPQLFRNCVTKLLNSEVIQEKLVSPHSPEPCISCVRDALCVRWSSGLCPRPPQIQVMPHPLLRWGETLSLVLYSLHGNQKSSPKAWFCSTTPSRLSLFIEGLSWSSSLGL